MFIVSVKFMGAFPDGDKIVEVSSPSGGGNSYQILVANHYWGIVSRFKDGWAVRLQLDWPEYCAGDLQPLLDMLMLEKQNDN